jgi:hypothetical protein
MHLDIIQTIAAERSKSLQEHAAAHRRTAQIRRSRPTRRLRPFARLTRAGSGLRPRVAWRADAGQAGRSSSRKPTFTVTWK